MNILGDGQEIRVSSCSEWNEFYARFKKGGARKAKGNEGDPCRIYVELHYFMYHLLRFRFY